MPVVLNKIDPVIINNVQQQTMEEVVHTSKKIRVSKDKKDSRDGKRQYGNDKIEQLNSILETMDIDVRLQIQGDSIDVTAGDGRVLKTYTRDAVEELFQKMEDMLGVLIDIKR